MRRARTRCSMLPRRHRRVTSPKGGGSRRAGIFAYATAISQPAMIVYPVRVAGRWRGEDIVAALKYFNRKQLVDVILLARGGGSLEDLWASTRKSSRRDCGVHDSRCERRGARSDFTIAIWWRSARFHGLACEIVVRVRRNCSGTSTSWNTKSRNKCVTCCSSRNT